MTIVALLAVLAYLVTVPVASNATPEAEISIINDHETKCTGDNTCETKCHDYVTIAFNKPQFVTSFGVLGGLERKLGQAHQCYFSHVEVELNGNNQAIASDSKNAQLTPQQGSNVSISKPADKITIQSVCGGSAKCVFEVKQLDIAQWGDLKRAEACAPGQKVQDNNCVTCPANTYSKEYHATECTECVAGTTSREGASDCSIIAR